jgi:outer membrane lipoprotein-sorting protein
MRIAATRLALLALPAALLTAAAAQDGDEAEKRFRAMEQRLNKARTVQLAFRVDADLGGEKAKLSGTLALAAGNKARLRVKGAVLGTNVDAELVSDGARMRAIDQLSALRLEEPAPKHLNEIMTAALSRSGLFLNLDLFSKQLDHKDGDQLKPAELFAVSDLKLGRKENLMGREAQILTYAVRYDAKRKLNATVWIDTETGLPLKRVLTPQQGQSKEQITETYTDWKLDTKLDPKQFELPK